MTTPSIDNSTVGEWVRLAERALSAGDQMQADELFARIRAVDPEHPAVLNTAAVQELQTGNAAAARALLERAVQRDKGSARYWMNLAGALRRLGLLSEELAALESVLAIEPRQTLALLQKGAVLELQGKRRGAAKIYTNALQTIPPGTQVPAVLRGLVQKAVDAVRANDDAMESFLRTQLADVRREHRGEDQRRFDHCLDALLGRRRIYTPQPTFLHFPKLPAWEFCPRGDFPWLASVEMATQEIRCELERVLAEDASRLEPYIAYPQGVPLDQWAELNHSRRWSVFYLWRDGTPVQEHLARCPKTAEMLRSAPLLDVPGYAPTAFFSILDAKSHIPAHTGVTNTRLIVHLALVIPPSCRFRVGSELREWRKGEAWVFDDTIEHEAWNDSNMPRAVLIFDIWNPYLSPAERDLVRSAVQGVRAYYRDESPLHGSI
jgi:aspartate beta-hydroxylase